MSCEGQNSVLQDGGRGQLVEDILCKIQPLGNTNIILKNITLTNILSCPN